jgi:hypothetical protein
MWMVIITLVLVLAWALEPGSSKAGPSLLAISCSCVLYYA